ncbi:MAG TPA: patatin-like phospholipase family protein [Gemmatimonadaceae bacterium]|nr:patatin-like phospholipase family protein [Gemmatimonadaceae bacterium]
MSLIERLHPALPKRVLALDGGGIRGIITIEIRVALERMLRERTGGGAEFRLVDYFDDIAGTSAGAIFSTCLALASGAAPS